MRQTHSFRGHVDDTLALTIESPTFMGLGAAVKGLVKVVRLPD